MSTNDLWDHDPAIVVADATGNPSEKFKGPNMTLPKRLRTLPFKAHDKKGIRMRQGHHKNGDLPQDARHFGQRIPKIYLRLTRPVD